MSTAGTLSQTDQTENSTQNKSNTDSSATAGTSGTECETCTKCMTVFSQNKIRMMYDGDFALDTFEKIALKWKDCIICLFYDEGPESKDWGKIFSISAQRIHGPQMAACNIELSTSLARAFTEISSNGGHPYHWAGLKGYPFILVYRSGVPVGVYDGDAAVAPFVDYCVSLACNYNYFERELLRSGVQVEKNYQMGPAGFYPREGMNVRTKSYEFVNGKPIRDYQRIPISEQGSPLAKAEENLLNQQGQQGQQQNNQEQQQQPEQTQAQQQTSTSGTEPTSEERQEFSMPPPPQQLPTPQTPGYEEQGSF